MLDIQCVDKRLKPACLFDHWSLCPKAMVSYLKILHNEGLVTNQLRVLLVGMDVIVYHLLSKTWLESLYSQELNFVDITSNLAQPSLITNTAKTAQTRKTFGQWCQQTNLSDPRYVDEIKITEGVNVPTLFGLLLGYPCIYWYDIAISEENNLSGYALQLFQIKGYLKSNPLLHQSHNSMKIKSLAHTSMTENCYSITNDNKSFATIYSFTIPELLVASLRDQIWAWYQAWETSVPWYDLFSRVEMSEQTTTPAAVCL